MQSGWSTLKWEASYAEMATSLHFSYSSVTSPCHYAMSLPGKPVPTLATRTKSAKPGRQSLK